jgi:succinate-acetate transporter protein
MFWVTRIFELLSATKKLNDSKTHIMSAVSNLMLVLLLSMFGIFLSAIMMGGLLYLIYLQLVLSGFSVLVAMLCTAALTLAILAVAGLWASAMFGRVRADVEQVFHSQSPIVAPVINKVSNVAGSFLSGLRNKPQKAVERTRR